MKRNSILVALLALVLADGFARAGIPLPERLGALAGETGGRAITFAVILVAMLWLRSLVAFTRGELARAATRPADLARARLGATVSPGLLRDGALSAGLD